MNNILIISFENMNVRTEEIYWKNSNNSRSLSFKKDKKLLSILGINDVFFLAFDFNVTKNKVNKKLESLMSIIPNIKECYLLCDRDSKSFSELQIENNFSRLKKIILAKKGLGIESVQYLKYKYEGQSFESFLKAHDENLKLPDKYSKADKDIYKKTMGPNGTAYKTLVKNMHYFDGLNNFKLR